MAQFLIFSVPHTEFDGRHYVLQILARMIGKSVTFNCSFCSFKLNEYPKGSAILFICQNCDFKILTINELFQIALGEVFNPMLVKPFLCPNCGEEMRYCYSEYSIQLWICPNDGTRIYRKG